MSIVKIQCQVLEKVIRCAVTHKNNCTKTNVKRKWQWYISHQSFIHFLSSNLLLGRLYLSFAPFPRFLTQHISSDKPLLIAATTVTNIALLITSISSVSKSKLHFLSYYYATCAIALANSRLIPGNSFHVNIELIALTITMKILCCVWVVVVNMCGDGWGMASAS